MNEQNIKNLSVKHLSKKELKLVSTCGQCNSKEIHFFVDGEGFQNKQCTDCGNGGWFPTWYDNFPIVLSGFLDDGSFDSELLEGFCPYCKKFGLLRKKQTHFNGWSACCKKCYDFFGNPALMKYDEFSDENLDRDSREMVGHILNGYHFGFNECCIHYFLALNCPNGIHDKIPENHQSPTGENSGLLCPECQYKKMSDKI